ncbi:hypothetical protein KAT73_04945 [candidate division WOR-3 bacterium]|nr:hypothetical protein [candidate division WOR-3 bacterium]
MYKMGKVIFHEVQRFRQVWLWTIILFIAGVAWYGFIQQLILKIPFGNHPTPNIVMIITWIIAGMGLPALFCSTRLITEVRTDGLYIHYLPFHFSPRRIPFNEIKSFKARTYSPLMEYGGWGIRIGLRGQAYNVSGNQGVQFVLFNGKRILIGSQKTEELARAIDIAMGKSNKDEF